MSYRHATSPLSRRRFLGRAVVGLTTAAALPILQACGQAATPTPAPAKPTEAPKPAAAPTAAPTAAPAATKPAAAGASPTPAAAAAPTSAPAAAKPSGGQRASILHWSHPLSKDDMTVFGPLIKKFQDAGNNIDVSVELIPWNGRIERKMSAVAAKTSPDTSYLNVDEFTTYVEENALVPLDPYVGAQDREDLLPGPRNAMDWKGKLYEFPVLHAFRVAYYNKDVWEKSGLDPEKTPVKWEELEDTFKKVKGAKDAGKHPAWPTAISGLGHPLQTFNPWFYQSGGNLIAPDGKSGYDSPAGVEAIKWSVHLVDEYVGPSDKASKGTDLNERFGSGQVAYLHNQELSLITQMEKDFPQTKFGIANVQENKRRWTHGGVGCFGIWAPSQKRDETWKWINFLTNTGNLEYNKGFGFVPPRQSVLTEYLKSATAQYKRAIEEAKFADIEKHPRLWDMWDVLGPGVQAAMAKSQAPEEAIHAVAAKVNKDILKIG